MSRQGAVAVIGAGVIGSAVACALAREGRRVLLLDRADPGTTGASYGNVGHIAAELVEPLPSPSLLFGFWRELFIRNGPLDIPLRRLPGLLPWTARFAAAAFRRHANTQHLAPLVKPATATLERWLEDVGQRGLLRRHGHHEIWLGNDAGKQARIQASAMDRLGVRTESTPSGLLQNVSGAARAGEAAGLWFPDSGHVVDPSEVVRAFASAALSQGTQFLKTEVQALRPRGSEIKVLTQNGPVIADQVVVCAGPWSASLLEPWGIKVPLQSVRGYHIELPNHSPLIDAPILYSNERLLMTPMSGRLRASSYMEFLPPEAASDPRKPRRLREKVRKLGYRCELEGASWVGSRPILPDYLPGIGRTPRSAKVLYAVGHQHIGLTIAPITAELIADLLAGRAPRADIAAFDLRRFGATRHFRDEPTDEHTAHTG